MEAVPRHRLLCMREWGMVRNDRTGNKIYSSKNREGFRYVKLTLERVYIKSVALMVAEVWLPDRPSQFNSVIHLDGDRGNCSSSNIRWRPRTYAMEYHRQFANGARELVRASPFVELTETFKETFESLSAAGKAYGVLDRIILNNLTENWVNQRNGRALEPAYPTMHVFQYI